MHVAFIIQFLFFEDDEEIGRIRSAIDKEVLANQNKKKLLGDVLKDRVKSANMAAASQYGGMTPRTLGTASRGFTSGLSSAISGAGVSNSNCYNIRLLKDEVFAKEHVHSLHFGLSFTQTSEEQQPS